MHKARGTELSGFLLLPIPTSGLFGAAQGDRNSGALGADPGPQGVLRMIKVTCPPCLAALHPQQPSKSTVHDFFPKFILARILLAGFLLPCGSSYKFPSSWEKGYRA